ncbi:MAG: hypothetical protein H6P99_1491 [Holophagaceae bacterium]|nr:hypothetical protein [Holophagaceae bacterium]
MAWLASSLVATMSQPRKHHYLPQFYLRGFSADKIHVFRVEKNSRKWICGNIKNLAAIRDFHIDDGEGSHDPQHIEKALAQLESAHAQDLADLLRDGITNLAALGEVVGLLSMLRMRVPAVKDYVQSSLTSQIKAKFRAMAKAGALPPPPEGFEQLLDPKNLQFEALNWKCLDIMFGMACSKTNISMLAGMRATLLFSPQGHPFITGDQPVSLFLPTNSPGALCGVGPDHPSAVVSLPLSSGKLLILDNRDGPHEERMATPAEVQEFNRRTIVMAKHYLFCQEKPDSLRIPIRRAKGIFAGFIHSDDYDKFGFIQSHMNIAIGQQRKS